MILPRAVVNFGLLLVASLATLSWPRVSGAAALGQPPLAACDYTRDEAALAAAGWKTAFQDDFSGTLAQWTTWTGGAYNDELQHYQGANLHVAAGVLTIAARQENVNGATTPSDPTRRSFAWTSGRLETTQHFSAGATGTPTVRMAARLKLPAGYGLWPAFWSYGDPWPTQGEIDILEARGQLPFEYSTAYWYGRGSGVNQVENSAFTVQARTSLTDCWHVYEVIWARDTLTFLFDGHAVDVKSGGWIPSMYRKQQRVTVNLAVGGNFFTRLDPALIVPGALQVDWVRVHTR
ncbi:MAG: glycoside hydrolase family 16 protein [Cytophagaceae bacterium]|nr:glycoside hydrolase family 16 protein [Gemmatimonadaceae bacterium]